MATRIRKWLEVGAFKSPDTFSGRVLSGVLLQPIISHHYPDLTGNPEKDARLASIRTKVEKNVQREFGQRIKALLEQYDFRIPLTQGKGKDLTDTEKELIRLVVAMAKDFVPGFQHNVEPPLMNRPRGSATVGGEPLYAAVRGRVENNGETIKAACSYLSRHSQRFRSHPPAALEAAYHRFVRQAREALVDVRNDEIYNDLTDILGFPELLRQMRRRQENAPHSATKRRTAS